MSEVELAKVLKTKKTVNTSRSTQFALRTWKAWLQQSDFVEDEKKPIEVYTKQELSEFLAELPNRTILVHFGGISCSFCRHGYFSKIRTMARPNSRNMPPKRTKNARLGINRWRNNF